MEDWIRALKNTSKRPLNQSNKELLNGFHDWFVCSHARPTFCNICREALNGVTSHGLSCEICKFKAHKRCAPKAARNCKWTTLASIGSNQIIEDEDRNICMPHQWLEGNLPVNAKCSYCEKACGSVLRMQDFRCLWCKAYVHSHCKDNFYKKCNFGVCRVSILPPTHINTVASDGFIRASKAPNTSPLVVFVNSKSGDNQGVKFLRKFKQLLNPFQVFDLIQDGPIMGLRMFQKFDCFRVLVCGGDGSVGWVLREIDALNLHKQCQIGVLPLGTGNDLARVLGWGSALDDDNQLPKLLESFERATTKMLDRWSMMTYELPVNMNPTNTNSVNNNNSNTLTTTNNSHNASSSNLKANTSRKPDDSTTSSTISNSNQTKNLKLNPTDIVTSTSNLNMITSETNLNVLKEYIWYHLNNLLQNENADILIESSQILNCKLNELLMRINECNNILLSESLKTTKLNPNSKASSQYMLNVTSSLISDRCVALKQKLNEFFTVLKNELKTNHESISVIDSTNNSSSFNHLLTTNSAEASIVNHEIPDELLYSPSSTSSSCASPTSDSSSESYHDNKLNGDLVVSSNNLSVQINCKTSSSTLKLNDALAEKSECNNNGYPNENNSSNNSIKRRIMLNSISKLYKHKRRVMTRANSLKKSIKQLIKIADIKNFDSMLNSNKLSRKNNHEIRININECKSTNDIPNLKNYYDYEDDCLHDNNTHENNWIKKTSTTNDISMMNNQANSRSQRPNSLNIVSHNTQECEFDFTKNKSRSFLAEELNENFKKSLSFNRPKSVTNLNDNNIVINNQKQAITSNDIIANNAETASSNSIKCKDDSSNSGTFNDFTSLLGKSPSILTINRTLAGINDVPLASEEQSCMSTPNTTNLSLSIDSIYKQQQKLQTNVGCPNSNTKQSLLSRPNQLDLFDKHTSVVNKSLLAKTTSNDTNDGAPKIRITSTGDDDGLNYESDCPRLDTSRSPSCLGYITSTSSLSITPNGAYDLNAPPSTSTNSKFSLSPKTKQKQIPAPLFLLPPSCSSLAIHKNSVPNLNSSPSTNNLSSRMTDFKHLRVPNSPSNISSSGSCYSKTTLPSPRISKKYSKEIMSSTMHLQLPAKRGISALSSSFRRRSLSKSSDKSSSPTSPSSPKLVFKYNPVSSPFSFVGQALLFNADALCAPIAAPVINEPILDLYAEKAVMNNYFGIGLDAKLALEFHMTREEHPEKCRSRIRNHMLYGILGSKEFLQRTCKNLEQKILLECDGTTIPLKNVQGIVVLNIPSYTGGVNFWGQNSKDENIFTVPSYDDKILEVVAVSGCMQMALSRVVSIKSNRIAQCHTVKIQILGPEGVPVQVDGEAWIQQPGFIYLVHKNRAQMLTRNKVFEHTLKTWSEKQKNDPHLNASLSRDEFNALQCVLDDSITLIKRIKTASLRNINIETDLCGYAIQASSNLQEISVNGKILEKSLRQQVTDFLNSIRTLHVETGLFINEKANKLNIEPETIEKIQSGLNDLKISLKKLNDCRGIFQFPIENDVFSDDLEYKRKSRFGIVQRYKKSKIKHKDDKELLKTLHGIPIEEWGPDEVGLWLESLNLSEYKAAFLRHDIRGTEIRNLERRDLRELGIVKVGHIKRILNASKEIPKKVAIEKQSV